LGQRGLRQKVVGPPRARASLRMPSFWVRHSNTPRSRLSGRIISGLLALENLLFLEPVLLEARERGHSRVRRVGLTAALFVVQVRTAIRAQSPAITLADHLQRQRQQQLLPQHVRQEESFSFVESNLGLVVFQLVNGRLL